MSKFDDKVVLLGAPPSDFEDEYGWIVPAGTLAPGATHPLFAAASFVEKPPPTEAAQLARPDRGVAAGHWETACLQPAP